MWWTCWIWNSDNEMWVITNASHEISSWSTNHIWHVCNKTKVALYNIYLKLWDQWFWRIHYRWWFILSWIVNHWSFSFTFVSPCWPLILSSIGSNILCVWEFPISKARHYDLDMLHQWIPDLLITCYTNELSFLY